MSRFTIPILLFAAFLCGWVFAFLNVFNALLSSLEHTWNISPGTVIPLLVLLLPLGLGGAAALTVDRANKHLISLAVLTGLLALTGWYVYWLPGVIRTDADLVSSCHGSNAPASCHHGPISPDSYFGTTLLVLFWLIGVVLVLVSSLVTSLIISFIMKHRRKHYHSSE